MALVISLGAHSESQSATPVERGLSDGDLLGYASRSYDKRAMTQKRVVLGTNRGIRVVADFPCSDLCPDFTVRVIHYEVPTGQDCARIGGIEKMLRVPEGAWAQNETFCFPKVLIEHWNRYKR
jgi:hypothetical protein